MSGVLRRGVAPAFLFLSGVVVAAVAAAADTAKPAAAPTGRTSSAVASNIPDELIYLAKDEAAAVAAGDKPGCTKGRMVLTYQPDTGFLEEGAVFRAEEVGFAVGEAARAGRLSCLIIEAVAYDRAMFTKLRDEYAVPNDVTLMWIPKSP